MNGPDDPVTQARLLQLAAMVEERAIGALREIGTRKAELSARRAALDASVAAARRDRDVDAGAAHAAERFAAWSMAERGRINIALAAVEADLAVARSDALAAFGRRDALDRMVKAAAEAGKALSLRRKA